MYESYSSSGQSAERLRPPACWAAALGALAVACFLTACSSSASTAPTSPGPFASQASQVVTDLAAGNFTAVESKFDPAMMKANQAVPLDKGMGCLPAGAGCVPKPRHADVVLKDQFDLEQVPVTMADCRVPLRSPTVVAKREGRSTPGVERARHPMTLGI
jgi:hypothetical protein